MLCLKSALIRSFSQIPFDLTITVWERYSGKVLVVISSKMHGMGIVLITSNSFVFVIYILDFIQIIIYLSESMAR